MMVQRSFMMPTKNGPICIKRIDKREARKRFYEGEDIYLKPCKINPTSKWVDYVIISKTLSGFLIALLMLLNIITAIIKLELMQVFMLLIIKF